MAKPKAQLPEPVGQALSAEESGVLFELLLQHSPRLRLHNGAESQASELLALRKEENKSPKLLVDPLPRTFLGHAENRGGSLAMSAAVFRGGYLCRLSALVRAEGEAKHEGHEALRLRLETPLRQIRSLLISLSQDQNPLTIELVTDGAPLTLKMHARTPESVAQVTQPRESLEPKTVFPRGRRTQMADLVEADTFQEWLRAAAKLAAKANKAGRGGDSGTTESSTESSSGKADEKRRPDSGDDPAKQTPKRSKAQRATLVLADERLSQIYRSLLREFGFEVELFTSFEEFLKQGSLKEGELLIMDLMEEEVHGVDWLRDYLADSELEDIRFVMVGDSLGQARENEWKDLGHGLFLRESLPNNWIRTKLREWLTAGASPVNLPDSSQPLIVIADDDSELLRSLEEALLNREYRVATARDGQQALSKALKFEPRLILLDVDMPKYSGLEVLQNLRRVHAPEEMLVVMMTADSNQETVSEALRLGIADYIAKPFDKQSLVKRISSLLANPRQA